MSQLTVAQPWHFIENHYASLNEMDWAHNHLLALVRHIQATGLSQRIFAVTSLDNLIISSYTPFEFGHETLRVQFDRASQVFIFDYTIRQSQEPEFHRSYPAELGVEKFDQFIKWIRW